MEFESVLVNTDGTAENGVARKNGRAAGQSLSEACRDVDLLKKRRGLATPRLRNGFTQIVHQWVVLGAFAMAVVFTSHAAAQSADSRPLRIILSVAPGGGTDTVARVFLPKLQTSLGRPVIIESKPGGGGSIAADYVFRAPPDGSIVLVGTIGTQIIDPLLYKNLKYKPGDFVAIAPLGAALSFLVGPKTSSLQTTEQLIVRARGTSLNYGHWGPGSSAYLAAKEFIAATGIKDAVGIPYAGSGPTLQAVLGGFLDFSFLSAPLVMGNLQNLKVYGLASSQRYDGAPQIPTLAEQGISVNIDAWVGLFAPPKTPEASLVKLRQAVAAASSNPEIRVQLTRLGMRVMPMTSPNEFQAFVGQEAEHWTEFVKRFKISIDE